MRTVAILMPAGDGAVQIVEVKRVLVPRGAGDQIAGVLAEVGQGVALRCLRKLVFPRIGIRSVAKSRSRVRPSPQRGDGCLRLHADVGVIAGDLVAVDEVARHVLREEGVVHDHVRVAGNFVPVAARNRRR